LHVDMLKYDASDERAPLQLYTEHEMKIGTDWS